MATNEEKAQLALDSKNAIKQAIINKGVEVGDVFSEYASAIENISSGDIPETGYYESDGETLSNIEAGTLIYSIDETTKSSMSVTDSNWVNGCGCTLNSWDGIDDSGCSLIENGYNEAAIFVGRGVAEYWDGIDGCGYSLLNNGYSGCAMIIGSGTLEGQEWVNGSGCTLNSWDGIDDNGSSLFESGYTGSAMIIGSGLIGDSDWVNGCGNFLENEYGNGCAIIIGSGLVDSFSWVNGEGNYLDNLCGIDEFGNQLSTGYILNVGSGLVEESMWVNGCGCTLNSWDGIDDNGCSLYDEHSGDALIIGSGLIDSGSQGECIYKIGGTDSGVIWYNDGSTSQGKVFYIDACGSLGHLNGEIYGGQVYMTTSGFEGFDGFVQIENFPYESGNYYYDADTRSFGSARFGTMDDLLN